MSNGQWVSVKERLPVPNKEVPVLTGGGRETVGWCCDGSWYVLDDSGYDWYKQVVIAWYDVPSPTMEQIANWM